MKKILVTVALLMSLASSAFASDGMIEHFFKFSASDDSAVEEVNYYLDRGAKVKFLDNTTRGTGSVLVSMVLQIPEDVYTNQKYKKK